ncbi:MAG: hypothetical protein IJT20_05440 [Synergistaceae bacterium]|nr:hypothetical protein [Synergistaceae bacterium]
MLTITSTFAVPLDILWPLRLIVIVLPVSTTKASVVVISPPNVIVPSVFNAVFKFSRAVISPSALASGELHKKTNAHNNKSHFTRFMIKLTPFKVKNFYIKNPSAFMGRGISHEKYRRIYLYLLLNLFYLWYFVV